MTTKRYALTDRDFAMFQKEVFYWLNRLGLMDWAVCFEWTDAQDNEVAAVEPYVVGRNAVFFLSRSILFRPTKWQLQRVAFHEALELLHCQLGCIANTRHIGPTEVREQIHALIRTWENVFFCAERPQKGKGP